jgi:hypothetical protein
MRSIMPNRQWQREARWAKGDLPNVGARRWNQIQLGQTRMHRIRHSLPALRESKRR